MPAMRRAVVLADGGSSKQLETLHDVAFLLEQLRRGGIASRSRILLSCLHVHRAVSRSIHRYIIARR